MKLSNYNITRLKNTKLEDYKFLYVVVKLILTDIDRNSRKSLELLYSITFLLQNWLKFLRVRAGESGQGIEDLHGVTGFHGLGSTRSGIAVPTGVMFLTVSACLHNRSSQWFKTPPICRSISNHSSPGLHNVRKILTVVTKYENTN